jgi:hypothetical protein
MRRTPAHAITGAGAIVAAGLLPLPAHAGASAPGSASGYCDAQNNLTLADKDRLLRVTALVRAELERSAADVAIVSRTGLSLGRWNIRYSHAGLSLRRGADTPWSVRQLYYACDERQPRIFDQGLAAFFFGLDRPDLGHVSVVLLPRREAGEGDGAAAGPGDQREGAVRRAALDDQLALSLLGGRYSANAYPFSTRYQNCNQWLVELLAAAWGGIAPAPDAREQAQRWLAAQHYEPARVEVGWRPIQWLGATFSRWPHNDDHPEEDLAAARYRISLPAAVEGLVRAQVPGAARLQFCYTPRHVLVRRGWGEPLPEACEPGPGDERIAID